MTKKIFSLLLALLLSLSLPLAAYAQDRMDVLFDEPRLLDADEIHSLLSRLYQVENKYQVQIAIAAVNTVGNMSIDDYVEDYYDSNEFGYGPSRDGVLLLIAMEEREYRILANGFGADAISASDIERMGDIIAPSLSDGNYAKAFNDFVDECVYQIDGEINGFPFEFGKNLIISLVIGVVIALLATGFMKSQLKSVAKKNAATEYVKPGSMQITQSNDFFLYRVVDRKKKETNSSGSSGSSRNVGGGKF
jgi:uncharacterized protein